MPFQVPGERSRTPQYVEIDHLTWVESLPIIVEMAVRIAEGRHSPVEAAQTYWQGHILEV